MEGDTCISEGSVIFSYPKYFHYLDPQLSYRIEGDEIVVSAKAYAKRRGDPESVRRSDPVGQLF